MTRNTVTTSLVTATVTDVLAMSDKRFADLVSPASVKRDAASVTASVKGKAAKPETVAALVESIGSGTVTGTAGTSHADLVRLSQWHGARADLVKRSASDVIRAAYRLGMVGPRRTYTVAALAAALNVDRSLVNGLNPNRKGNSVKGTANRNGAGRKPNRDRAASNGASMASRDIGAALLHAASAVETLTDEDKRTDLVAALADDDIIRAARAIILHAATLAAVVDEVDAEQAATA